MTLSRLNGKPEGRWGPGRLASSVMTAGWGLENLILRAPSAEIGHLTWCLSTDGRMQTGCWTKPREQGNWPSQEPRLFSPGLDLEGWELNFGTVPFLVRLENNICLVEASRNIGIWPPRTKNLTPRSLQQLTTPLHHLSYERALLKVFRDLGFFCFFFFKAWATLISLRGPAVHVFVLQTLTFWYCLASPCVRHMDLHSVTVWVIKPSPSLWRPLGKLMGKGIKHRTQNYPSQGVRSLERVYTNFQNSHLLRDCKFLDTSNLPSVGSFGSKRHPGPPLPSVNAETEVEAGQNTEKSHGYTRGSDHFLHRNLFLLIRWLISYLVSWWSPPNSIFFLICSICQFPWCKHSC